MLWRKISTFSDLMLVEINFCQPKKGRYFRRDITSRGGNTFTYIILQLL